jgi:membrane protein
MRSPVIPKMFGTALRAWWDDDAPRLGASLAYYTLFAIAPVLLVATAIAGVVFGAEAVRGEIVGQLDQLVGREGAHARKKTSGSRNDAARMSASPRVC